MSSGDPQASEPTPDSPTSGASHPKTPPAETPQAERPTADASQGEAASQDAPQAESAQSETPQPNAEQMGSEQTGSEQTRSEQPAQSDSAQTGRPSSPIARGSGPLAARGLGVAKPASPAATPGKGPSGAKKGKPSKGKPAGKNQQSGAKSQGGGSPSGEAAKPSSGAKPAGPALGPLKMQPKTTPSGVSARAGGEGAAGEGQSTGAGDQQTPRPAGSSQRVAVPSLRQPLGDELQSELEAQLAEADLDSIMSGSAGIERRGEIEEGQRMQGTVLKTDEDSVYVALGGPDEGVISRLQFEEDPQIGSKVEAIVRGFNREDGLYNLVLPGQAMDVSDWEDLEEGTIVEAHVAAANSGGLEATVGNIRGFIPISQIAQYRVEDASEFVGQRMMCVVTECNPRRKNLVLSRRAVLEREREEQRKEQLEKMEPGDTLEGTVRSVKDFGAFVDLGGLDGLIHVSKLSWEQVKHPSDVLEVGQKVKVKVEKVDKQTGKIALSYRDLLENPWDTLEATISVGSVVKGTVTRIANFGAFVRIASGIEGLVHISELAGHRVSNVSSVLKEGDEVAVKVLSIERESQRIALSIKQAQSKAADAATKSVEEQEDEPPRELAVKRQHAGPLKGGVGKDSGGAQFGLKW